MPVDSATLQTVRPGNWANDVPNARPNEGKMQVVCTKAALCRLCGGSLSELIIMVFGFLFIIIFILPGTKSFVTGWI